MGVSDAIDLAREVDPGWLALTAEHGHVWSLVAWTALFFLAGAAVGYLGARMLATRGKPQAPGKPTRPSRPRTRRASWRRWRAMMRGFSRDKARAALAAYEADGMVDVGDYELVIIGSVQAGEGVFTLEAVALCGVTRTGSHYGITDEWRAFLREPKNLRALRELAG